MAYLRLAPAGLGLILLLGSASAGAAVAAPSAALTATQEQIQLPGQRQTDAQRLDAECARLRAELQRVNAEITALKRGDRGVRDDYRLRSRLADAEHLARRLTASEAELRRLRAPLLPGGSIPSPTPTAAPGQAPAEAPAVLEARADLLSDEARRLTLRAGTLERAADQLRTRQTLRRRAGHLERDPFAAMEGSKRFMVVPGAPATRGSGVPTTTDSATKGGPSPATESPTAGAPGATANPTPPPQSSPGTAPVPPSGPGVSTPTVPAVAPSGPTPQTTPQPTAQESGGGRTGDKGTSLSGPGTSAPGTTVAGSRALLDPQTAAELRRLEAGAGGRPLNEVERLQQAAAILARKAQVLESQAKALRARAAER